MAYKDTKSTKDYYKQFQIEWESACNGVKSAAKQKGNKSGGYGKDISDCILDLGNAVVMRAVEDYRLSAKILHTLPSRFARRRVAAQEMYDDCIEFFESDNFNIYTFADGKLVLSILEKEQREKYGYVIER